MLVGILARRIGQFILHLLITAALCLIIAPTAKSQDQIGIFWDQAYTQSDTTTSTPGEIITGHLVIFDPTSSGGILAWECEVDVDGPAFVTQ